MKKYKYFHWVSPDMRYGVGEALIYVKANSREHAKEKLKTAFSLKDDPDFIDGDIIEVKEFKQPKPIPVVS